MRKIIFLITLITCQFAYSQLTSKSDPLMVMYTKKTFVDEIKNGDELGPNLYGLKLLFEEAGVPESLLYVPNARAHVIIDEAQPACLVFKIKTQEREKKYLFSKPISFSSGSRLYQNSHSPSIDAEYLNPKGQVKSVTAIMDSRPREHLILLPSFSYGDILDRQISAINDHQKVKVYTGDLHKSQAAMFFKNRADFALMITPEVLAYTSVNPTETFRSYAIENVSLPITVHVMCNKTEAAKKWLEKIDVAILKIYKDPSYTQVYDSYHTKDEVEMIKEIMRKHDVGGS
jgi:uncharacterized protein (TIGR02285 family)